MNGEDNRRLQELYEKHRHAVNALSQGKNGGLVTLTARVGPDGHVSRKDAELNIRIFPLDTEEGEGR